MALKLKYTDEHGILHIDMSPTHSPTEKITDPKFDTINKRFGQYDIFGGKYDGGETSLFRSRYNSFEEELANTPYAFTERRTNEPILDITIDTFDSKNKDIDNIEDNRYFEKDLFGPKIDLNKDSFTVTQLIHAQDRYYDLSKSKGLVKDLAKSFEVKSAPSSAKIVTKSDDAFKVLSAESRSVKAAPKSPTISTSKKKRETSFAIIAEPTISRPTSPRSLPVEIRPGRVSPFKGRGFREETSRHSTPKTSTANSRSNSPPYKRTSSLTRIDKMAQAVTLPPPGPVHRPPRDFLKENMEEIRELSELNREKNEAEAEKKKQEEEIALLKEMGILDNKGELKSAVNSRTNSRSNSPGKVNFRSRSNSPSAILNHRNISGSSEYLNKDDNVARPVAHRSRLRSVSKSQPESNNGSPKHSKIPKRQSSVSPTRTNSRQSIERNLNRNQRFISNSTSSIHETIRIGSQVHDKRVTQSSQHLSVSPQHIKGKPPISPGKTGPPPSNKSINPKRLSPIVGTPNKSPVEDHKAGSLKTPAKPSTIARKATKTTGNITATSRLNSRQPSRTTSRDPSPEKRKLATKPVTKGINGISKTTMKTTNTQKPPVSNKIENKKPVSRTNSVKNLSRAPSTKNLNEKPPLNRQLSKKDITEKSKSTSKINEVASKKTNGEKAATTTTKKDDAAKSLNVDKKQRKEEENKVDANVGDELVRQDNETQYDKTKNETGELVILTKKNVVSMTTAAITSQPLEVVATVTNQLPTALEKAREKGIFERLSSKDSLLGKEDEKESKSTEEEKKPVKPKTYERTIFSEDNVRLKPLQPPYNNPQVEKVKQKIDSIFKEPEISTENILATAKAKETPKNVVEKLKMTEKEIETEVTNKIEEGKEEINKKGQEMNSKIRSEATKIVDSIMTPIETPIEIQKPIVDIDKTIEPIVTVVSDKKMIAKAEIIEKINETLVQGGPEVEVQSSNLSTPGVDKIILQSKSAKGSASDKSHSNGGFPQSTSTTPKPPPRSNRDQKSKSQSPPVEPTETVETPKPNICSRLMGKCKAKCCPCCTKSPDEEEERKERVDEVTESVEKKKLWQKMNCFKKKIPEEDIEIAAGKGTTIEFETETKRKRKLRDVLCACCRKRKVADIEPPHRVEASPPVMSEDVVNETGCCGKTKEIERRDSILSDQAPTTCCNNRLGRWIRGACRRQSEQSSSRRTSLFSKNKSLSPTLPPEDTRKKLDPSLIEHTSVMRGAIPVLPAALAYFCLLCNIVVPGLGTIFSGMFCLCFGIPRFGVHDGAKHRIGSFIINLLVGAGQLFTVLFCLVGWGWSIWWGVIMVKTSRKYAKLKAEAAAEEAEAPPVTSNNHTRA